MDDMSPSTTHAILNGSRVRCVAPEECSHELPRSCFESSGSVVTGVQTNEAKRCMLALLDMSYPNVFFTSFHVQPEKKCPCAKLSIVTTARIKRRNARPQDSDSLRVRQKQV